MPFRDARRFEHLRLQNRARSQDVEATGFGSDLPEIQHWILAVTRGGLVQATYWLANLEHGLVQESSIRRRLCWRTIMYMTR